MADYKALAREMYESMVPGQDVDAMVDRYMAEDFVEHEAIPGMASTREAPREGFAMLFAAFPDLRIVVHDMLQDDDKVAARVTFTGTHLGDFMGVPASGNHVEWNAIDILQFRGDQAVAHWGVMDLAGAMAQMGVGPG
jgi:steroid delta-isomerase-like uncharacterized protein